MNQDYKIECYQKTFQTLKNNPRVKNLTYPEKKENLEFSCDIGECHTEYNMRLKLDFLTIRASRVYEGKSDSQLTELAQQLTQGTSVKFTAYNETIIFQLSLPLVGIADEDAKNLAIQEADAFYHFLFKVNGLNAAIPPAQKKEEPASVKDKTYSNAKEQLPIKQQDKIAPQNLTEEKTSKKKGILPGRSINVIPKSNNNTETISSKKAPDSEEKESRQNEMEWLIALRQDLQKKESMLDQKEKSIAEKESDLKEKADQITSKEQELEKRLEKIREEEASDEERKSEVESYKKQIHQLTEKHQKTNEDMQQQNQEIERLRKEIEQKDSLIDSNGKWAVSIKTERDQLLEQLQSKDLELESIRNENSSEHILSEEAKSQIEEMQITIKTLTKELEEEKQNVQNISEKCHELEQSKLEALRKKDFYKNSASEKTKVISELESRLQEYRENSQIETPNEILEDFADTRKENRKLKREIEDLKAENASAESTLLEEISRYQKLIKEKDSEIKKAIVENTPEARAKQILNELASAGILMTEEQTENGICLKGKRDQCEIIISVSDGTILCRKSVSRPQKYKNELQDWNEEEITEAYYIQKKEIICKKAYHNALMDLNRVLRKFALLH